MLLSLATTILLVVAGVTTAPLTALGSRSEEGFIDPSSYTRTERPKAPVVVSGDITSTLLGGLTTQQKMARKR
jgi:hypothetical protein